MTDWILARSQQRDWDIIRARSSRLVTWARVVLYAACVGFLVVAALCVLTVRTAVQQAAVDEHALTVKVDADADEAHRLLLEAGLTARETRLAATEERASLGKWNTTADNLNALLLSVKATSDGVGKSQAEITARSLDVLKSGDAAISGLVPLETNLNNEVSALDAATTHLDAAVSNPHIAGTLTHLDTTASNVDAMSADVRQKVHSVLHPTWTTRVWNTVQTVFIDAGKIFF